MNAHETCSGPGLFVFLGFLGFVCFFEYSPRPSLGFGYPPPSSLPHAGPGRTGLRGPSGLGPGLGNGRLIKRGRIQDFPSLFAQQLPLPRQTTGGWLAGGGLRWEEARPVSALTAVTLEAAWVWGDQISVCPHSKGFLAPSCQGKGQGDLWDPERVSPDSGKTLALPGQTWTPGSFPGTPIPLPYGFYLFCPHWVWTSRVRARE